MIESNISSANGEWSDENKLNTYSYLLEINASSPDILYPEPLVYYNFENTNTSNYRDGFLTWITDLSINNNIGIRGGSGVLNIKSEGAPAGPSPSSSIEMRDNYINVEGVKFDQIREGTGSYTFSAWIKPSNLDGNRVFFGQTGAGIHNGIRNNSFLHQAHWFSDSDGQTHLGNYLDSDKDGWIRKLHLMDQINGAIFRRSVIGRSKILSQQWTFINRLWRYSRSYQGLIDEVIYWDSVLTGRQFNHLLMDLAH